MRYLLFISLLTVFSFPNFSQTITPAYAVFETAGSKTLTITPCQNCNWDIISRPSWLTINYTSPTTISLTTVGYYGNQNSILSFTFYTDDYSTDTQIDIPVIFGPSTLSIDKSVINAPAQISYSYSNVTVTSNNFWHTTSDSWIQLVNPSDDIISSGDAGIVTTKVRMTPQTYLSAYARTGTLTFNAGTTATKTVTVNQAAALPLIDIYQPNHQNIDTLRFDWNTTTIPDGKGSYLNQINCIANFLWKASLNGVTWVRMGNITSSSNDQVSNNNGAGGFDIFPVTNNTGAARTATLTFTETTGTYSISRKIVIIQSPKLTTDIFDAVPKGNFNIYPNPSKGLVNIQGSNASTIEIYNIQGTKLQSLETASELIITLPPGLYYLKFMDASGAILDSKKLIIE